MVQHDYSVKKGETFDRTLFFTSFDGTIIDLTGRTAKCQIRENADALEVISEVECTIDPEAGSIKLLIPAEETALIPTGCYVYDLKTTDVSGITRYYIGGYFDVLPSVTK